MRPNTPIPSMLLVLSLLIMTTMVPAMAVEAGDGHKDFKVDKHLWGKHAGEFITWSPDGKYVVSQTSTNQQSDFSFKYWKVKDGWSTVEVSTQHMGIIYCFDWSPDSRYLATGFRDIIIYDIPGGWSHVRTVSPEDSAIIRTMDWHPSKNWLAVGNEIGVLHVIDTTTGESVESFAASGRWIERVKWSPDGDKIAVADVEGTVIIYDTSTWNETWTLSKHRESTKGLAWSPDGSELITTSFDSNIYLWDMTNGQFKQKIGGHGQDVAVFDVQWHASNGLVVTAGSSFILVWDSGTWDLLQKIEVGHKDKKAFATTVTWNVDGSKFVSTNPDSVDVWSQNVEEPQDSMTELYYQICGVVFAVAVIGLLGYAGYQRYLTMQVDRKEEEKEEDEEEEEEEEEDEEEEDEEDEEEEEEEEEDTKRRKRKERRKKGKKKGW